MPSHNYHAPSSVLHGKSALSSVLPLLTLFTLSQARPWRAGISATWPFHSHTQVRQQLDIHSAHALNAAFASSYQSAAFRHYAPSR